MDKAHNFAGRLLSSLKAFAFSFSVRFSRSDIPFCSGVYGTVVSKTILTSLAQFFISLLIYSPALSHHSETTFSLDSFSTLTFHSLKIAGKSLLRHRK